MVTLCTTRFKTKKLCIYPAQPLAYSPASYAAQKKIISLTGPSGREVCGLSLAGIVGSNPAAA